jgi:hypothetical protein
MKCGLKKIKIICPMSDSLKAKEMKKYRECKFGMFLVILEEKFLHEMEFENFFDRYCN